MFRSIVSIGELDAKKRLAISIGVCVPYVVANLTDWNFNQNESGFLKEQPEVSDHLQKLVNEVVQDFQVENVKVKTINDLYPKMTGFSFLKNLTIYLPDYLNVTSFDQLRSTQINPLLKKNYNFELKQEEWPSERGIKVIESFLLSDESKKFLIARELNAQSTNLYKLLTIFISTYLALLVQNKYQIKMKTMAAKKMKSAFFGSRNPIVQFFLFTLPVTFMAVFTIYAMEYFKLQQDSDALAITLGSCKRNDLEKNVPEMINPKYFIGALEYYMKNSYREKALRDLIVKSETLNQMDKFRILGLNLERQQNNDIKGKFQVRPNNYDRLNTIKKWEETF